MLCLSLLPRLAAQPAFEWVRQAWPTNDGMLDFGGALTVGGGDCFVAGSFVGNITFGNNTLGNSLHPYFIARYGQTGQLLWAVSDLITSSALFSINGIVVDPQLNCYITGSVMGGWDTQTDYFVGKYNSSGVHQWLQRFGDYTADDYSLGIAMDSAGQVFVLAQEIGITCVKKIDAAGNSTKFVTVQVNDYNFRQLSLAVSRSDQLILAGTFTGRGFFGGGTNNNDLISRGRSDIFIAKYDASGSLLRLTQVGGIDAESCSVVATDSSENVYVVGTIYGVTVFGTTTLTNRYGARGDTFLAKCDASGAFLWAKQVDLNSPKLSVDSAGYIFLVGSFEGVITMDGHVLVSRGGKDVYIIKLDPDGRYLWAQQAGGEGNDYAGGFGVTSSGASYLAAYLPALGVIGCTQVISPTTEQLVVAKLSASPSPPTFLSEPSGVTVDQGQSVTIEALACGSPMISYQWLHNNTVVAGAVNSQLSLTNVIPSDGGKYRLVASNAYGSITSSVAVLKVNAICNLAEATVLPPRNITWAPDRVGVTLNGSVNPSGRETWAWFELTIPDPNWSYTNITMPIAVGHGTSPVPVSERVLDLEPSLEYSCRLVVSNNLGICFAGDRRFQTPGDMFQVAQAVLTTYGLNPWAKWGDFNQDGYPDVLLASSYGTKLFLNNHQEGFTNSGTSLTPTNATEFSAALADYNGDGSLDLAHTCLIGGPGNYQLTGAIYRNSGNGTFSEIPGRITGVRKGGIAWGDFNRDGRPDLLISGLTSNPYQPEVPLTRLYRNNGDDTFTEVSSGLPNLRALVTWGDYDNDGYPDVFLMGQSYAEQSSQYVSQLYRNNRDGTFSLVPAAFIGAADGSVAWGDFDQDGNLDLLLSGYTARMGQEAYITKLYRNNGDGTFSNYGIGLPLATYGGVAWGDYDNDGLPDIGIAARSGSTTFGVYRNWGHGNFALTTALYDGGGNGLTVDWADYNLDGTLDFLVTTSYGGAYIFQNYGDYPVSPTLSIEKASACSGHFSPPVTLKGIVGRNYVFESSSNLTTWTAHGIFMNASGSVEFPDSTSTNRPLMFYRARVAP